MKRFLLIVIFLSFSVYSQNVSDKKLIAYYTYEDFTTQKGTDLGLISGTANSSWGQNKIYVMEGDKEKAINTNELWGFTIGDYLFRMNKYSLRIPLLVVKSEDKVFYIDGYMYLQKAIYGTDSGSSFRESDGCFYSDDLNSKVYEITKIIKNEKDNPKYKDLIECIKQSKTRLGYQSQFNGYVKCIQ